MQEIMDIKNDNSTYIANVYKNTCNKLFNLVASQGCTIVAFTIYLGHQKTSNMSSMDFYVCFDIAVKTVQFLDCIWECKLSETETKVNSSILSFKCVKKYIF